MAAVYRGEIWCDDCADYIRDDIYSGRFDHERGLSRDEWEAAHGFDDDRDYDSDDYPKWCQDDAEADSPQHCGAGSGCVNHIELADGNDVGCLIGSSLTADGRRYVEDAVTEDLLSGYTDSVAATVWLDYYGDELELEIDQCADCGDYFDVCSLDDSDLCEDCAAKYERAENDG